MTTCNATCFRPSIDVLEHREAPSGLAGSPFEWLNPGPHFLIAAQGLHTNSAVPQTRPFHATDAGTAALNGPIAVGTTITASASGHATHLGAFTLHDTSTIVAIEGPIVHIGEGHADLIAANGDILKASFTGTIDLSTFTATVTFEWTAGGTGRFANASGTTEWHIQLNSDFTYTAVADGIIRY